ncbi:hypothetical protein L3Q82_003932 [Scortum barcoo]|uniref:Uncharacterized protein n=1 Tax=Scortum barcoo TaxID=214431 RepID=A0ACB8X5R2_9TELE|nr:hypothetical protein L3Q82_003932 [Scortum barcoo]
MPLASSGGGFPGRCSPWRHVPPGGGLGEDPGHAGENYVSRLAWERLGVPPEELEEVSGSCTLSFSPTASSNEGSYVVQLVMEDFPSQTITLTQTNVDAAVSSCTEGLYLPKFLAPTPANRARLYTPVNQTLEINISAEANTSQIFELLFSGPYNTSQVTGGGAGQYMLRWTPSQDEDGESHPICFVVQALFNSVKYHSELRCVIVSVGVRKYTTEYNHFNNYTRRHDNTSTKPEKRVKIPNIVNLIHYIVVIYMVDIVVLRYKVSLHSCTDLTWTCLSGICGTESVVLNDVDMESSGEWCQREGISTRQLPSNAPFELLLNSGNWIFNVQNITEWKTVTLVELRNRSDTGQANRSPQTTILPMLRVPSNCQRDFNLLVFDPDGDEVKCRYGNSALSKCSTCTPPSVLSLSSSCTLSFSPTASSNEGSYVVQLVMEDFPRQTITLTQTNVDAAVSSCTEGLYLPKFLAPTPANRARLYTPVNQTLEINISAEANTSQIFELLFSGPYNTSQVTGGGAGQYMLRWTPSQNEDGESHPICFVVQALFNQVSLGELRCVIVSVGVGLRMKLSSSYLLSEDYIRNNIIQQIRDEMVRRGLPSDIALRLVEQWRLDRFNVQRITEWKAVTLVELRNRSDTGQANRSPQTTILPMLSLDQFESQECLVACVTDQVSLYTFSVLVRLTDVHWCSGIKLHDEFTSLPREKMICRILLLITLTSCVCGTFVVNVTQSSYQAEENQNITLEWTFTIKKEMNLTFLYILCALFS